MHDPGLALPSRPAVPGLAAIERLSDARGMMQHSQLDIPDPAHGYCVDDNARALILMVEQGEAGPWTEVFARFVADAWHPARGRFRNFMAHDGAWLEEAGSDDSNGRALQALGVTAAAARDPALRAWAGGLFDEAALALAELRSPRAMAFCLLGAVRAARAPGLVADVVSRLTELAAHAARPGWTWFEPSLAYDNARLPEALLRGGRALGREDVVDLGLELLRWLAARQRAPEGHFRAVGSESFGRPYTPPARYDQQPLEAQGMIEACAAAFAANGDPLWLKQAEAAFAWFGGANDGGVALADPASGECYDGLTPAGANLNRGAESVLAFQLASVAIGRLRAAEATR